MDQALLGSFGAWKPGGRFLEAGGCELHGPPRAEQRIMFGLGAARGRSPPKHPCLLSPRILKGLAYMVNIPNGLTCRACLTSFLANNNSRADCDRRLKGVSMMQLASPATKRSGLVESAQELSRVAPSRGQTNSWFTKMGGRFWCLQREPG
jgi:hypothetical protein